LSLGGDGKDGKDHRYRALAWLPLVLVAATSLAWLVAPPSAREPILVVEIEASKAAALVGCAAAALAFEPGDYLRRAWTLLGACVVLLFTRDVFALAAHAQSSGVPGPHGSAAFLVQGALATLGNGCSVAGTAMVARAWGVAGLEAGGEGRAAWALLPGAVLLAVLANGWPIASDVRALAEGDAFATVPLASDLADAAVIVLLAPLARTALALRGGVLRWVWTFLAISGVLWLAFDATYGLLAAMKVDPERTRGLLEPLRALPTLYAFSAGLAQRNAVVGAEAP
jgi:hypothetical protein